MSYPAKAASRQGLLAREAPFRRCSACTACFGGWITGDPAPERRRRRQVEWGDQRRCRTEAVQPRRRVAVIGSGVSGLSCAWLLSQSMRRRALRGRAAPRRPQRHGRLERRSRRQRLHRLQRAHLSEPDRDVRASAHADAGERHVLCRLDRPRAAGILGLRAARARRADAQCAAAALLVDDEGHRALLPNRARGRRPRRSRHARRISRRRRLRPAVPRGLSLSDGGGDLVDAGDGRRRASGRGLHPLQRQSRPARSVRPAGMAHRRRRQHRLRPPARRPRSATACWSAGRRAGSAAARRASR